MSTMGVAPRIVLDGPLPRPPAYTLDTVAQEAPDDAHWRAGANIFPYVAGLPSGHDPCSDGTLRAKETPSETVIPDEFPTFTAYLGEICSGLGIGAWDDFRLRANAALVARDNWALERQLVAADFVDAPHLGDSNNDRPAGNSAITARNAIAWLEEAIAGTGQAGVLHVTPGVVIAASDAFHDDRGILRTSVGTPVIVGHGYVGADGATGGAPAVAGQSWIYATGPILYRRSAELINLPETVAEALDREDNTVIYRAERDLWVGWDGQLQAAVLADWTP